MLSDSLYNEFIKYVNKSNFTFDVSADMIIEDVEQNLKELIEDSLYVNGLFDNLELLKSNLATNKKKDIVKYNSEIKNYLSRNLITRSFYEAGKIEFSLQNDPYIDSALHILQHKSKYQETLSP